MDIKAKNELYNEVEALTQKNETLKEEIQVLKETIKSQGDQLVIFHAKEEKPDTPSSTCAKVILEIKDDEIKQLKEEIKKLKEENKTIKGEYYTESEFNGEYPFRRQMTKNELIGYCQVVHQLNRQHKRIIGESIDELANRQILILKVKEIYGEENNNWEDDDFFISQVQERERVYTKFHEGTLVEDPDPLGENKKKLEEATAKAKCLDALVYGIGWEHLNELCDGTTKARLIESGQFVPEDFAE